MSMGLPAEVAPRAMSAALARAANGMAYAVLTCGIVIDLGFAAAYPDRLLWPCLVALLVLFPMVALGRRSRHPLAGVSYLVVGAVATYVHTLVLASAVPEVIASAVLWLAPPKIVLLLVVGSGLGFVPALAWLLSGFAVAEAATFLALERAGLTPVLDVLTLAILVEAALVCALGFLSVRGAVRAAPRLQRAARDELLDDVRARMEVRAAALMHDTILSHLAAIAGTRDAELPDRLKSQMESDLQILTGQEWLRTTPDAAPDADSEHRVSPLRDAIAEVHAEGLDVTATGDFASLLRLSAEQAQALGLAAKQCLVNVIRHSGVMAAEVAVYSSDDEVSVMIIDAGKGFSDASVGADRLGLRASVQSRIESVGGVVQVWSTPGAGTSILLQLPVAATSDGLEADVPLPAGGPRESAEGVS